jgi:hypothetical protein
LSRRQKYVQFLQKLLEARLITSKTVCQVSKSVGDIAVCRDIIMMSTEANKSVDFETMVYRRALGLDYAPDLERLKLKQKAIEVLMETTRCY